MKINGSWAVGGGLFLGLGTGFFFLKTHPLYFVGCLFLELGLGLLVGSQGTNKNS